MTKIFNKKRGFTLIELLVVIAIIGILSSIVLVSLKGAKDRANDGRIISDMSQIRTQAEIFYDNHVGTYTGLAADPDIINLVADVADMKGTCAIHINDIVGQEGTSYCVETHLNATGQYYCVDSTLHGAQTATDPNAVGACDGTTFDCTP